MNTKKCGGSVKKSRLVKSLADGGFLDFLSPQDNNLYESMIKDKTPEEIAGIQEMFQKKQLGSFAEATAASQGPGVDDIISSGVMTLGVPGLIAGTTYKVGKKFITGAKERREAEEERLAGTQRESTTRFLAKKESESFQAGGIIKGKGTGTSDSIKAKLKEGDFIVPYTTPYPEVADALIKALGIKHDAPLKDGYIDVSVSDGEIIIPADRIDEANEMLSRKGMTLDELAPKAEVKEKNLAKGGTVTYKGKEYIWNPKKKRYVGPDFAFDKTGRKWGIGPDEGSGWEDMSKEELAAVFAQNRPTTLEKAGGVETVMGTTQVVDALLKLGTLEARPDRVISKELAEVSKETIRRSEYGLEPGIKSKAERDIERRRRGALGIATSGGAGSGGTTLAAQIAAGIGTQENLAVLAGIDQTAKERKERLADAARLAVGERRDVIREGEIERYDKMEDVLAGELLAGISNIVGAQRYKQFLDQKSERDKLYSGLINVT